MKKIILISFFLLSLVFVDQASADTLQDYSSYATTTLATQQTSPSTAQIQYLGTGLDYIVTGYEAMVYDTGINVSISTLQMYSYLVECPSLANCNTGAVTLAGATSTAGFLNSMASTTYQVTFDDAVTLDPSKKYAIKIYFQDLGPNAFPQWYGEPVPAYVISKCGSGGVIPNCSSASLGSTSSNGGKVDTLYFKLFGTDTTPSHSYTNFLIPSEGMTTSSTLVNLSFIYTTESIDDIDEYEIQLRDLTSATTTLISLTGSITGSTGTINRSVNLIEGHSYSYDACLYDSSDPLPRQAFCAIYGQVHFSVVNNDNFYQDVYGQQGNDTPAELEEECAVTNFVDNIFCGIRRVAVYLFFPSQDSIDLLLSATTTVSENLPFSYFYDVYDVYTSSGSISATSTINLYTDFTVMSTSTRVLIPDRITWFSTSTVSTFMTPSTISMFKSLFSIVIWIAFASMLFFRIKHLFHL